MKRAIKRSLQSLMIVPVLALGAAMVMPILQPVDVHAQNINRGIRGGLDDATPGEERRGLFTGRNVFQTVVNTLLFIIGAVSVIMLIFGGFRYVTSGGDSNAVTSAKNTILYAVIGLVVALLAWGVLDFVITSITNN